MTRIIIHGVTRMEDAILAAEAGADGFGVVLASGVRRIPASQARQIVQTVRQRGHTLQAVGLFIDVPAWQVNQMASHCGFDWVHLGGQENWDTARQMVRPVIKGFRCGPDKNLATLKADITVGFRVLGRDRLLVNLDCRQPTPAACWALESETIRQLAAQFPVIISGGLTAENVGEVVAKIKPWGVDVAAGVEVNGVKDPARVRRFIEAVRKAAPTGVPA
jgi:phosphoribosylanthranilate isomerase